VCGGRRLAMPAVQSMISSLACGVASLGPAAIPRDQFPREDPCAENGPVESKLNAVALTSIFRRKIPVET